MDGNSVSILFILVFFGSLLFVSLSTDHDDHYFHHGYGDGDHDHDVVDDFFFDYLSHVFDISPIFLDCLFSGGLMMGSHTCTERPGHYTKPFITENMVISITK